MKNEIEKMPKAEFGGVLQVGDADLPCFVLNDGRRVFSTRGMLESLNYAPNANIQGIFKSTDIQPFIPKQRLETIDFITHTGTRAKGYDVERFMDFCHALSEAYENMGDQLTPRNKQAAIKANAIIRACSKIGIIALVDEATGYQYYRQENALQFKLKLFLSEEMRGWEKTFPDDLWIQFARLTHWGGQPTKNRPRYWGYLVMELIYRYLDKDVAQYIKENKPKPRKGQNYHQWFNEDYGVRKLIEHINRVVGMAQACETIDELRDKMAYYYGGKPLQLEMFLDKNVRNDTLKIDMPFDEAIKKLAEVDTKDKEQKAS